MALWRHVLLAVLLMALVMEGACSPPTGVPSSVQEYFEYAEGHAYMGSERVVWEHGRLVFIRRVADMEGHGTFREISEKLNPPQEAWDHFWIQLDTAGFWEWQANYRSAMSSAADGSSWKVEARHANRHLKSQGYNAVPATYSVFRDAVYQLMEAGRRK
jgi:hypothetical protein